MSTALTTDVKTHVVYTKDRATFFITQKQYEALITLSGGDKVKGIELDNNYISFSSISNIYTIEKFYEAHPDKRPDPTLRHVNEIFPDSKIMPIEERFKGDAGEKMIKAMEKTIEKRKAAGESIEYCERMLKIWKAKKEMRDKKIEKQKPPT